MTNEQVNLLDNFALLQVGFPDSKMMDKNKFAYFFKKEDCVLFTKKNYTHDEYIAIIKGVFERNDDALNQEEEIFLNEHRDMANVYSISVYSKVPE